MSSYIINIARQVELDKRDVKLVQKIIGTNSSNIRKNVVLVVLPIITCLYLRTHINTKVKTKFESKLTRLFYIARFKFCSKFRTKRCWLHSKFQTKLPLINSLYSKLLFKKFIQNNCLYYWFTMVYKGVINQSFNHTILGTRFYFLDGNNTLPTTFSTLDLL